MKMVNPFDRLKKKEFTPMSLFPASKRVRTSMPLARAVPIYYNEMIQGNTISLDAAELSRFATLNVPIMNEFEVSLGAYFVPYVAFDEFFDTPQIQKYLSTHSNDAASMFSIKLNARNFFNPAADDATRIHPITLQASFLRGIDLVGSLFDHLGYYIGQNEDINSSNKIPYLRRDSDTWSNVGFRNGGLLLRELYSGESRSFYFVDSNTGYGFSSNQYSTEFNEADGSKSRIILGADAFAYSIVKNLSRSSALQVEQAYTNINASLSSSDIPLIDHINYWLFGVVRYDGWSPYMKWDDVFGSLTQVAFWKSYEAYAESNIRFAYVGPNFRANVVRALAYYRIYADWFLDDNFIKRDEFLTKIGQAYFLAALSGTNLIDSFTYDFMLDANSPAQIFTEDLAAGRCLPVMAEKNYFTAARQSETYLGFGDFKYNNGGVETPVGQTIHEHFFNRAYQRFKDFITRMGYDFRDNAAALYGHKTSDESLLRSQLFGSYDFDVKVGDIAQTSGSTETSELGSFAGMAISKNGTPKFTFTANENGCVMILAWVRPKNVSIAGSMSRDMFKKDYHDYLLPTFGGVGMQDILMNEIYPSGQNQVNEKFGVTEIYSEYMSVLNECSGLMRTTQSYWNMDRILKRKPVALDNKDGAKLLYYNDRWYDDMMRIFNDTVSDPILCTWYINGSVTRQLPEVIRTDF